mgnify:FL=1
MWQYATYKIFDRLVEGEILKDEALVSWSSDELIFRIDIADIKEGCRKMRHFVSTDPELARYASFIKVEAFRLMRLRETSFYVKEIFINLDRDDVHGDEVFAFRPVIKCANAQGKAPISLPASFCQLLMSHFRICAMLQSVSWGACK